MNSVKLKRLLCSITIENLQFEKKNGLNFKFKLQIRLLKNKIIEKLAPLFKSNL